MKVKSVVVDAMATCGQTAIVTDVRSKNKYVDGQRTAEPDGYAVSVVLPERGYVELVVSVPAIPDALESLVGNPIVQFEGLALSIYGRQDDLRIAAKASSVQIVTGKTKT